MCGDRWRGGWELLGDYWRIFSTKSDEKKANKVWIPRGVVVVVAFFDFFYGVGRVSPNLVDCEKNENIS